MLRLSVVHSPVGPQKGPGLDDDIQSPGLEDRHMYVGDEKYDWWKPYDQDSETGDDAEKRLRSCRKVAIDYDGTLTADPAFFKDLIRHIRSRGGKAYLVTGRSEVDAGEVKRFVRLHGLKFDREFYYPVPYHMGWVSWDALFEVKVGSWKGKVIAEIGADAIVDDNPIFVAQIVRRNPGITAFTPTMEDR